MYTRFEEQRAKARPDMQLTPTQQVAYLAKRRTLTDIGYARWVGHNIARNIRDGRLSPYDLTRRYWTDTMFNNARQMQMAEIYHVKQAYVLHALAAANQWLQQRLEA